MIALLEKAELDKEIVQDWLCLLHFALYSATQSWEFLICEIFYLEIVAAILFDLIQFSPLIGPIS